MAGVRRESSAGGSALPSAASGSDMVKGEGAGNLIICQHAEVGMRRALLHDLCGEGDLVSGRAPLSEKRLLKPTSSPYLGRCVISRSEDSAVGSTLAVVVPRANPGI